MSDRALHFGIPLPSAPSGCPADSRSSVHAMSDGHLQGPRGHVSSPCLPTLASAHWDMLHAQGFPLLSSPREGSGRALWALFLFLARVALPSLCRPLLICEMSMPHRAACED